jgi:hypothetical protein
MKFEMEKAIMDWLKLQYDMANVKKKNYQRYAVASVCCQTKVEYLQKLNKAIRGGHNRKLENTRPSGVIKLEGLYKKREPAVFRAYFVRGTVSNLFIDNQT